MGLKKSPILIVGMARSGTTLTSHILGSLPNVHIEVEPHALWKSGNFKYYNDEEYDVTPKNVEKIRSKFLKGLPPHKIFVEKSPINCLRPKLVHAVFPDAKIVYIERDPIRCIHSNYKRSLENDSFKPSITLKKYFLYTGSKDLEGAIGKRKLFDQISLKDAPFLTINIIKMLYLRNIKKKLPFGPKLKDFYRIVKDEGLLYYHVKVYKRAEFYKAIYQDIYGKNMKVFKMEALMKNPEEIKALIEFTGLDYTQELLAQIQKSFDNERVIKAIKKNEIDEEIKKMMIENI